MSQLGVVLADSPVVWIGRSLREAFFMFWETLWPLILGFGLSGVVQAFVPKHRMETSMGDHGPKAVAKASGYGMVSSSCSYAATAMGKSLFQKGADFITAMAFMFASTNLVLELGIILIVLMGWEFAAAEFVGGPIMIALLALLGGWVFTRRLTDPARERLQQGQMVGGHDHAVMVGVSDERQDELEALPWKTKLTSKGAWADSASYTMADLKMLRRELIIGYLIAGFLAVMVPTGAWNALFMKGHGFWTSLQNVIIGPLIAIVAFVCSIGNVPLAAALWKGGISFGGVISFIFADLITFPLLAIYRKYYGPKLTWRILGFFWAIMAAAGLATEGIFALLGLIPSHSTGSVVETTWKWNYTTWLNFVFLGLFAVLYWLYRNQQRLGGGQGYALDPVCGMQVQTANAPASRQVDGKHYWFCSDHCAGRFDAAPARYTATGAVTEHAADAHAAHGDHGQPVAVQLGRVQHGAAVPNAGDAGTAIDPVCGMTVEIAHAAATRVHDGIDHWFCSQGCAQRFDADPTEYLQRPASDTAPPTDSLHHHEHGHDPGG